MRERQGNPASPGRAFASNKLLEDWKLSEVALESLGCPAMENEMAVGGLIDSERSMRYPANWRIKAINLFAIGYLFASEPRTKRE